MLNAELAELLGVPPGSATTVACARMKTLKDKFDKQLKAENDAHAANKIKWETKLCKGLGCEKDEAQRLRNQAEWDTIQASHDKEKKRLETMLNKIEGFISERPMSDCP